MKIEGRSAFGLAFSVRALRAVAFEIHEKKRDARHALSSHPCNFDGGHPVS